MNHNWNGEITSQIAAACRVLDEETDTEVAVQTALNCVVALCEGESGALQWPAVEQSHFAARIRTIRAGAGGDIPPACLDQVTRTGRSIVPPGHDDLSNHEDASDVFGPICVLSLRSRQATFGAMAVRLNGGPPVSAAIWDAMKVIARFVSMRLVIASDSALAEGLRAQQDRARDLDRAARTRRATRLFGGSDAGAYSEIVGCSEALLKLLAKTDRVAEGSQIVLIVGESGTGKELVARAIHRKSCPGKPFVCVNAGSLRGDLLRSELFGHEKGAFTGATKKLLGELLRADGGILFLDEVENLCPEGQKDLLRFLEDSLVRPVGGSKDVRVSVRVVCATNRDLRALVAEGKFREDLLYRIQGSVLKVPPLRERVEDIPLLVHRWLAEGEPGTIHAEAMARLVAEHWPGNIRELKQVFAAARLLCDGEIRTEHVAEVLQDHRHAPDSGTPQLAALLVEEKRLQSVIVVVAHEASDGDRKKAGALLGLTESGFSKHSERVGVRLPWRKKFR